jgi:hypothetical protein
MRWNKGNAQLRDISRRALGRMAEAIEKSSISLGFRFLPTQKQAEDAG